MDGRDIDTNTSAAALGLRVFVDLNQDPTFSPPNAGDYCMLQGISSAEDTTFATGALSRHVRRVLYPVFTKIQ